MARSKSMHENHKNKIKSWKTLGVCMIERIWELLFGEFKIPSKFLSEILHWNSQMPISRKHFEFQIGAFSRLF